MWLMLYAALGNDFRDLRLKSPFFSILSQDLSLHRAKEIDDISTFLVNPGSMGQIAILFSEGGIGKTYLASQILQVLQQKGFSCQYYSNIKELNEDIDFLCRNFRKSKAIIFIDDVPFDFEDDPVFKSYRLKIIVFSSQHVGNRKTTVRVLFFSPISSFSAERLATIFFQK